METDLFKVLILMSHNNLFKGSITRVSNKSTNFLTKGFDIFSLYNLALPITRVGFTIPRTNNTPKYLNIE